MNRQIQMNCLGGFQKQAIQLDILIWFPVSICIDIGIWLAVSVRIYIQIRNDAYF